MYGANHCAKAFPPVYRRRLPFQNPILRLPAFGQAAEGTQVPGADQQVAVRAFGRHDRVDRVGERCPLDSHGGGRSGDL
jgi:hypothetical protein